MAVNNLGRNQLYSPTNPNQLMTPQTIIIGRDPIAADTCEISTLWINSLTNSYFILTSKGVWTPQTQTSTTVENLTVTGNVNLSSGATANTVSVGTGAGNKQVTVGSTNGASATFINSGTGGITLNSNLTGEILLISNAETAAALTITNDALVGTCFLTGQTVASAATATITINNANITAFSAVLVTVSNLNVSGNGAYLCLNGTTISTGSMVLHVINNSGAILAAADTINIAFQVLG